MTPNPYKNPNPQPEKNPKQEIDTKELQKLLNIYGGNLAVDGVLGDKTARSLKAFQKNRGLTVSGVPDNATIKELKGI